MWRVLYDGLTEIRRLNWACLPDRQRNIYYHNVYHCYQFVLASIYINIYFVLASSTVQCFGIFRPFHDSEDPRPKYRYTGITGIFFPVYRYRNFLIPNIPTSIPMKQWFQIGNDIKMHFMLSFIHVSSLNYLYNPLFVPIESNLGIKCLLGIIHNYNMIKSVSFDVPQFIYRLQL